MLALIYVVFFFWILKTFFYLEEILEFLSYSMYKLYEGLLPNTTNALPTSPPPHRICSDFCMYYQTLLENLE